MRTIEIGKKPEVDQLCLIDYGGDKIGLIKEVSENGFVTVKIWDNRSMDWQIGMMTFADYNVHELTDYNRKRLDHLNILEPYKSYLP